MFFLFQPHQKPARGPPAVARHSQPKSSNRRQATTEMHWHSFLSAFPFSHRVPLLSNQFQSSPFEVLDGWLGTLHLFPTHHFSLNTGPHT